MQTLKEIYNIKFGKLVLAFILSGLITFPIINTIQSNYSPVKILLIIIALVSAVLFVIKNTDYFFAPDKSFQHNLSKTILLLVLLFLSSVSNFRLLNAAPFFNEDIIIKGYVGDKGTNMNGLINTLEIKTACHEVINANVNKEMYDAYNSGDAIELQIKNGMLGDTYQWRFW